MAPTYILRLVVLALLIATTFFDWKREAVLRQQIEAMKEHIELLKQEAADRYVLDFRLAAALRQIRHYNGDKPVQLPNPDGSTFIDRLNPGESVTIGVYPVPPYHIPPEEPRQ